MPKSMTAYGRAEVSAPVGRMVVELQSVNRKFLDIAIHLPRELQCFDPDLRKWVGEALQRGRVTVTVFCFFDGSGPVRIKLNKDLAKGLATAWKEMAEDCDLPELSSADALLRVDGVVETVVDMQDEEAYRLPLQQAFTQALAAFVLMQEREGAALTKDFVDRLATIRTLTEKVAPLTSGSCERFRRRLLDRIRDVVEGADEDERVLREVALFAEKVDVTEEVTRLGSHIDHLATLLEGSVPVGKTIDFLLQEMFREVNTIGSKASDATLAHLVVTLKSELEKMREQVQNVE